AGAPGAGRGPGAGGRPDPAPRRTGPVGLPVRAGGAHVRALSGRCGRLRYRQLAPYSLAAATVWASAEAGAGYAAGASYGRLAARLGGAGALGATAGMLL